MEICFGFLICLLFGLEDNRNAYVRFFRGTSGAIVIHCFSIVSFFACTCPNRSGVGAIDNHDLFEDVFEQYDIPKAHEKNFPALLFDGLSSENVHFWCLTAFISNFTYYSIY